jgi:broad specificity phosphatase PhoE
MQLFIARHGETEENKQKRILGSTPGVLTEEGKAQAQALAEALAELHIDEVIASDLQRVADTCEPIQALHPDITITYTPQLRERSFGSWEGELRKSVDWQGIWEGATDEPNLSESIGAEPLEAFRERLAQQIVSLYESYGESDVRVLLVCHIGVMNACNYLQDPEGFSYTEFPNAQAVAFDIEKMAANSRKLYNMPA